MPNKNPLALPSKKQMAEEQIPLKSLVASLDAVADFRIDRQKLYPLSEILFLVLSAVASGFVEWEDIVDFGEAKLDWLRKYYSYENGIPSHDTVNRVMSLLDYRDFEEHFVLWATAGLKLPGGTVINLDGKKLRGSADKKAQQTPHTQGGKSAIHLVQAWCDSLQVCLCQYRTGDKSNEITAIPAILDWLDLSGCVVTIDAMGCQKAVTEKIIGGKADYAIGLKKNQPKLEGAVRGLFCSAAVIAEQELQAQAELGHFHEAACSGHGRIEKRACRVLPASLLPEELREGWAGLESLAEITAYRYQKTTGIFSTEKRYYISSLKAGAAELNRIVRSHWAIENNLHWCLDVQFGEDRSRKQAGNAAANFGIILRYALNLLKQFPDKGVSLHRKQNKCSLRDEYRENVLGI